jgi:eukaryotic-like serine/threonine-protein kinase
VPALLYQVVHRMPQRPGELVKLPRDVERVLALGMAKRPADRFATAAELADAFTAAASSKLGRELRERADANLAAHPWGSG